MPRIRQATPLADALAGLIRNLGFEKKLKEQQLIQRWAEIVGQQIAVHSKAVHFEGGKLFVEVDSAAWRQELHFMKAQIAYRLNEASETPMVREIILTNKKR
ncbi:MAG: DUF721 domain-containing protein [candidate division Zixibacteria bacterium]|nr:DUF721 domain-containing protein [candidate division Zixibacteria bacterium]